MPNFNSIKKSRIISIFWTFILIGTALLFNNQEEALVIIGLKIASFTYGSLLSFFILSKVSKKPSILSLVLGYIVGILVVFCFMKLQIAWTFFILGSVFTYFSIQFYVENGFLNTNLTLLGAGLIVIAIILLICAILLFSIIHVIREKK